LQKRAGLPMYEFDVFVNVAGGINVKEPAVDLAICLSIASSYFEKTVKQGSVVVGEVGLLGEIREVVAQDKRLKEAARLGYKDAISSNQVKFIRQALKKYIK
jgi:DNA repair protein RadA/Sms